MLVTIVLTPILANCAKQSSNIQTVLNKLQEAIEKLFQWFSANYLAANADKCNRLTISKTAIDIHTVTDMIRFRMKKESNY